MIAKLFGQDGKNLNFLSTLLDVNNNLVRSLNLRDLYCLHWVNLDSWLVWAEIDCTVNFGLPKQDIKLFKPVQQSRLRDYCPNIYTVDEGEEDLDLNSCGKKGSSHLTEKLNAYQDGSKKSKDLYRK